MRRLTIVFLALVNGCASSATSSSTSAPATQTIGSADVGRITVYSSASADVARLPFSTDAVWRILPAVFDSVGIQLSTYDAATRTIGNSGYKVRQRLGKVPLSRYLDCGNVQVGPSADTYDVFLSVVSTLKSDGVEGAVLSTTVDAKARPITINQAYSRCSSKGSLELRISGLVRSLLVK